MKKNHLITLLLLVISLALVACSAGQTEEAAPEPVTFTVEMSEYAYTPNKIEVQVGQMVTIELVNNGSQPHELMFGREVIMTDGLPNGYTTDLFESAGVEPMIMPESAGIMNMGEEMSMEDGDEHMDDEAMDDEHMDDEAMDDEQMDDKAMDDEHMDDEAMDDEQMDDEAMDDEHMDDEAMDDEHMDDGHMGTMVLLKENGDDASITFLVTEDMIGEWEMGCFELEGVHYLSGMTGTLVVTPKSG